MFNLDMDATMDPAKEKDLQNLQLSFIGKILATYTHEMKNHLAIIKESSGLIQDMIEMGKLPRKKKEAGLFLSTLQAIDDQLKRSVGVINILNRFGHRMDSPTSTFSMNEIIEELIVLMDRLAKQKRITLEGNFQDQLPSVNSNPSKLQLILYSLIQEKLGCLDAGSKIIFSTSVTNGSAVIRVCQQGDTLHANNGTNLTFRDLFLNTIKELNGEIEQQEEIREITISIPLTKQ
jgi:C4-dicarboxylate-specific signal transduction histidine kinase